jgi:hypothetical protein
MPFRAQMTNIYSFFSYLKIYPPFLAKNCTSILGHDCVTPSSINISHLWCGVAHLVARRLAGRQARVRFPARHHREVFPTEPQAMRRWRIASANVLYECDWMIVLYECYKKYKNKQKEWHTATKPLKIFHIVPKSAAISDINTPVLHLFGQIQLK